MTRELSEKEIAQLESQGCRCSDWSLVSVADGFDAGSVRNVCFDGEVQIGARCRIENVGIIRTTEDPTFGEGTICSVLNEAGNGNVMLYEGLSSQLAAIMVRYEDDKELTARLRSIVQSNIDINRPRCTTIGDDCTITFCRELTNVNIGADCEICGAARLVECTISPKGGVFISDGVICENVIVQAGASITDSARLYDTFVGEACHVGRGFTSENSVFFANSYMDNGESCAAFCGPFTVSHHKSSLLIGGMYSFYNAGSGTNYSNHAYKIGPIHYGTMHRGAKSASSAHILWPAQIGLFSMAMGKIQTHPDTQRLPFSYIIADGTTTTIVPGRNITTVGTYRDVNKWPTRDARQAEGRISLVNFDWLSPLTIEACIEGQNMLKELQQTQGTDVPLYAVDGGVIRNHSLNKGLQYYDLAIRMFLYNSMRDAQALLPTTSAGTGEWVDLAGMLAPKSEIDTLISDITNGNLTDIQAIEDRLADINDRYEDYKWAYAYRIATQRYRIDTLTDEDITRICDDCAPAREEWLRAVAKDADKEYGLGDVSQETLDSFVRKLK